MPPQIKYSLIFFFLILPQLGNTLLIPQSELELSHKDFEELMNQCIVDANGMKVYAHSMNVFIHENGRKTFQYFLEEENPQEINDALISRKNSQNPIVDKYTFPCEDKFLLLQKIYDRDPEIIEQLPPMCQETDSLLPLRQSSLQEFRDVPACEGRNQNLASCLGDITCNALLGSVNHIITSAASIGSLGMRFLSSEDSFTFNSKKYNQFLQKYGAPQCMSTDQSSCLSELTFGLIKSVFNFGEFLWDDLVLGFGGWVSKKVHLDNTASFIAKIKKGSDELQLKVNENFSNGLFHIENKTSDVAQFAGHQKKLPESEESSDLQKGWFKQAQSIVKSFFQYVTNGITHHFGCREWSGIPHAPGSRCLKPWQGMACMNCHEISNMFCGVLGYAGGELVNSFLLGGAIIRPSAYALRGTKVWLAKNQGTLLGDLANSTVSGAHKTIRLPIDKLIVPTLKGSKAGGIYVLETGKHAIASLFFSPKMKTLYEKLSDLRAKSAHTSSETKSLWQRTKQVTRIKSKRTKRRLSPLTSATSSAAKFTVSSLFKVTDWVFPIRPYFRLIGDAYVLGAKGKDALKLRSSLRRLHKLQKMSNRSGYDVAFRELLESSRQLARAQEDLAISTLRQNATELRPIYEEKLFASELRFKIANEKYLTEVSKIEKEMALRGERALANKIDQKLLDESEAVLTQLRRENALKSSNLSNLGQATSEEKSKIIDRDLQRPYSAKRVGEIIETTDGKNLQQTLLQRFPTLRSNPTQQMRFLDIAHKSPLSEDITWLALKRLQRTPVTGTELDLLESYLRYIKSIPLSKRHEAIEEIKYLFQPKEYVGRTHLQTFNSINTRLNTYQNSLLDSLIDDALQLDRKTTPRQVWEIESKKLSESPKYSILEKKAHEQRLILEELTYGCRASTKNKAFMDALKKFSFSTFIASQASYTSMYLKHTWDMPWDKKWLQQLGYEESMKVLLTLIMIKVFQNPGGSFAEKAYRAYIDTSLLTLVDIPAYNLFFSSSHAAHERMEELKNSPDFERKFKILAKHIDKNYPKDKIIDYFSRNLKYLLTFHPSAFDDDLTKEEREAITQKDLNDPSLDPKIRDKVMGLIFNKMYENQVGVISTGNAGMDRWVSSRVWNLGQTPRDIAIGMTNFYILCMGAKKPATAFSLALFVDIAHRSLNDYFFRPYKFEAAGGEPDKMGLQGEEWWNYDVYEDPSKQSIDTQYLQLINVLTQGGVDTSKP